MGDTIRISLSTFHAEEEVKVAWEILKALQLRERGPVLIACPTCGRLQFDMDTVVAEIERRLERYEQPIEVAVLGCAVNGIGEASHADFGITGAKNEGMIFAHGKPLRKVPQDRLVDELFAEIDKSLKGGGVETDERKAAEAADMARADRAGERRRADPGAHRRDGAGCGRGRARRRRADARGRARRGPPLQPRAGLTGSVWRGRRGDRRAMRLRPRRSPSRVSSRVAVGAAAGRRTSKYPASSVSTRRTTRPPRISSARRTPLARAHTAPDAHAGSARPLHHDRQAVCVVGGLRRAVGETQAGLEARPDLLRRGALARRVVVEQVLRVAPHARVAVRVLLLLVQERRLSREVVLAVGIGRVALQPELGVVDRQARGSRPASAARSR